MAYNSSFNPQQTNSQDDDIARAIKRSMQTGTFENQFRRAIEASRNSGSSGIGGGAFNDNSGGGFGHAQVSSGMNDMELALALSRTEQSGAQQNRGGRRSGGGGFAAHQQRLARSSGRPVFNVVRMGAGASGEAMRPGDDALDQDFVDLERVITNPNNLTRDAMKLFFEQRAGKLGTLKKFGFAQNGVAPLVDWLMGQYKTPKTIQKLNLSDKKTAFGIKNVLKTVCGLGGGTFEHEEAIDGVMGILDVFRGYNPGVSTVMETVANVVTGIMGNFKKIKTEELEAKSHKMMQDMHKTQLMMERNAATLKSFNMNEIEGKVKEMCHMFAGLFKENYQFHLKSNQTCYLLLGDVRASAIVKTIMADERHALIENSLWRGGQKMLKGRERSEVLDTSVVALKRNKKGAIQAMINAIGAMLRESGKDAMVSIHSNITTQIDTLIVYADQLAKRWEYGRKHAISLQQFLNKFVDTQAKDERRLTNEIRTSQQSTKDLEAEMKNIKKQIAKQKKVDAGRVIVAIITGGISEAVRALTSNESECKQKLNKARNQVTAHQKTMTDLKKQMSESRNAVGFAQRYANGCGEMADVARKQAAHMRGMRDDWVAGKAHIISGCENARKICEKLEVPMDYVERNLHEGQQQFDEEIFREGEQAVEDILRKGCQYIMDHQDYIRQSVQIGTLGGRQFKTIKNKQ